MKIIQKDRSGTAACKDVVGNLSLAFAQTRGTAGKRRQEDAILFGEAREMSEDQAIRAFGQAFERAHEEAGRTSRLGAVAALAYVRQNRKGGFDVVYAHLGDARIAAIAAHPADGSFKPWAGYHSMTYDHRPMRDADRIEEEGGNVDFGRLDGRFDVARGFGQAGVRGLGRKPDIRIHSFTARGKDPKRMLIAHSGSVMAYPNANLSVLRTAPVSQFRNAGAFTRRLLEREVEASSRWKPVDNASLVGVVLDGEQTAPVLIGVVDAKGRGDAPGFARDIAGALGRPFRP